MMMTLCLRLAAVMVLAAVASSATAATYYVSPAGNDAANGSVTQPFRTLVRGVGVLRPGDTLLVGPGVYAEDVNFRIPSGQSWAAAVTLKAADPQSRPIIRPPGGSWVLYFSTHQYVIVDGFILDGTSVTSDGLKVTAGSHHIRVQNSEIRHAPAQGVITTDGATAVELLGLDIHDNGRTDFDHGVYLSSPGNLISGCRIYRNAGWGIHAYGTFPDVGGNVVRDSYVFDNARVGGRGEGILLSSGPGNAAYNNVVYGNQTGIWVAYGATGTTLYHNTVARNRGPFGIYIAPDTSGTIVQNNIAYGNGTAVPIENRGSGGLVSHNLTNADPRFVDASAGDFRLRAGSPAIDGGVGTPVVTDIRGLRRTVGPPDIGAHELEEPPAAPTGLRITR